MRPAITIVLSAILLATPTQLVLAQDAQRESQVDSTRFQAPTHIGIPVIEPGSGAALLFAAGIRDHKFDPVSPPYRRSTVHEVVLTGARLFRGLVQAVGIIAGDYPSNRYYPNTRHR